MESSENDLNGIAFQYKGNRHTWHALTEDWRYTGPIFDAHTHIGNPENIDQMVNIEDEFGIAAQLAIVHTKEGFIAARENYPRRFVFAKYLSLNDIAHFEVDKVVDEINKTREQGFSLTKMWFGPRWLDYYEDVPSDFRIDDVRLQPVFEALEAAELPLLLHVGDPDTYYELHYQDSAKYGTKDDDLATLERIIERHPRLLFQLPHFGSQPEIHRLSNLSRWLDNYPNIIIDTASSRWMARELSKDVDIARSFLMKYSNRILFGTDLSTGRGDREYFRARYFAQRYLWETNVQGMPLPFEDVDTKDSGGTFINGLNLPLSALRKLYWENANRIYDLSS
ncbi:MAG: amidohydrolase family protein [Promethearchaeota archaeon]